VLHSRPISIPTRAQVLPLLAGAGGLCILLALFVMPHGTEVHDEIPLASPPKVFALSAEVANVEIVLVDDGEKVSVAGELHGFGLPTLRYAIEQHGWFTDLDASVKVRLPAAGLQQVVVQLARGNVKVTDATRAQLVASGAVRLDLRIASSDPLKRHAAAR